MQRFDRRVALVSGGLGSIGRAIGLRLAQEGAQVILGDLAAEDGEHGFPGGLPALVLSLDVTAEASWQSVVHVVLDRFGRLDVLVNNAGIIPAEPQAIDDVPLAEWHRIFAVNLDGVMLGTQATLREMKRRGGGAIVNIGSVAGYVGSKDNCVYGASKGAVRSLTKQAALSSAQNGYGVRVNAVHPGFVWTKLVEERALRRYGTRAAALEAFRAMNPMNLVVEPEDVAAAVAFLASDDARMITGADLVVDGGRLIQ